MFSSLFNFVIIVIIFLFYVVLHQPGLMSENVSWRGGLTGSASAAVLPGVKLSSLVGKKGSLDKLQSYWDVGFFLGASILAGDNMRVIQASEKLFKLKAPIW